MQAIKKQFAPKNKLILTVITVVILLTGSLAYAYSKKLGPFKQSVNTQSGKIDYSQPTEEQSTPAQDNTTKESQSITKPTPNNKPNESSGSQSPESSDIGVAMNLEPSGTTLKVGTLIQKPGANGICTLTLSRTGQKTRTLTAQTQVSGTVTTCKGFTVTGLVSGSWQVNLKYTSSSGNGSTSEKVNI